MTKNKLITEFDLIDHYFAKRAGQRADVILGIGDDCALLKAPTDQILAVSTDTLVAGVHFPLNTSPKALGHKSLAVSLSDLAAMGAEPAWVLLSLTLLQADDVWLTAFADGFFALLEYYSMQLIGGNTTQGPLSITTQVFGFLPPGKALRRDGAKPGDFIYVTGNLGDAGLALRWLKQESPFASIRQRLDEPTPRVKEGIALREIASSAIDISDGLAADLGHILDRSQVGARVYVERLPLSSALKQLPLAEAWRLATTAGDDYELCFTVPPSSRTQLESTFARLGFHYYCIGTIEKEPGLRLVYDDDKPFKIDIKGYEHFRKDNRLD